MKPVFMDNRGGNTLARAITAHLEYPQELRRALAKYGPTIREFPWRAGSGMIKGDRTGHVFCATVGKRIYLRFVPVKPDSGILSELGTCLRLSQMQ